MTTFTTPQSTPFPPDGAYPHTGAERSPLSINGLFALVIALVIIVTLLVTSGDAAADSPAQVDAAVATDTIEVYVVQPGDTLWEIATERALPGDDVQSLVDVLTESAGSASLDVGQRIVIYHRELRR